MASLKEPVSFPGILRGQELEATCTVSALKVTMPGTGISAYANYSVRSVSRPLPEGLYQLTVNGETRPIRHQRGYWLAAA